MQIERENVNLNCQSVFNSTRESSDDDSEWPCLVCGDPFANWLRETWVQCL